MKHLFQQPIFQWLRSRPWATLASGRSRWLETPLGMGLTTAALGMGLLGLGAWEPLEKVAHTGLFLTRNRLGATRWDDRLVIIAIDEASLATYGPYPWTRDRYAALLDKLMAAQPAAVGFDILMPEATPEDAQLAESLQFSSNVVLAAGGDGQGNAIQVTPTLTQPAQGSIRIGHVKHIPDEDGISRQAFLYERHGAAIAPSFAIALLETYQQSLTNLITTETVELPDINPRFLADPAQFDQTRPLWINWPGVTRSSNAHTLQSLDGLTTVSFAEVMADTGDGALAELQNKIVLVGYTAVGIVGQTEDALRTPFERRIPTAGVYLHAAILDNLLNDRFLTHLPLAWSLGLILLSGVGSSLVLQPLGLRGRLVLMLGLIPVWCAVAYGSFLAGVRLPVVAPIGTSLLGVAAFQFMEQRERQTLMDLFAINLSPEMANFIWQHKGELLAEGHIHAQELTATLLFTDIREFTTISETLPSEVLLPWLNRYFEEMTDCIMAHGGVVDKYIGDAIMAAFGAPVSHSGENAVQQDALAAVKASLAMVERLQTLNREFASQGLPTVRFGVGLHTGAVVAGTVGSRYRANYSLFGDTVNVAARLQDMTKQLTQQDPYPILMSEATYEQTRDRYTAVEKGQIQLRGRTTKTTVYTLASVHLEKCMPHAQGKSFHGMLCKSRPPLSS
ncbi:MAG: adenylate/guanylate cyclase domain-containing protein [Leptolyngbya sp. SIO1E4]|nr:adenylate/guanylate cyclase domain-containing protein [Leptolyngbya sp. SIO1E4]